MTVWKTHVYVHTMPKVTLGRAHSLNTCKGPTRWGEGVISPISHAKGPSPEGYGEMTFSRLQHSSKRESLDSFVTFIDVYSDLGAGNYGEGNLGSAFRQLW